VFELYTVENALELVDESVALFHRNETDFEGMETLLGIVLWAISLAIDGGHF